MKVRCLTCGKEYEVPAAIANPLLIEYARKCTFCPGAAWLELPEDSREALHDQRQQQIEDRFNRK